MNIVFRVDASVYIGSGHVMRCVTLAEELKNRGANVIFVCREYSGNMIEYIREKNIPSFGFPLLKPVDTNQEETFDVWLDIEETKKIILNSFQKVHLLIVDHYSLDYKWEKEMRPFVNKIMVIDDLANRNHDCDLLLDQNFYLENNRYTGLINKDCQQLLGPKYSLLRSEFAKAKRKQLPKNGRIRNILVFFGGSDVNNETCKVLEALRKADRGDIKVDVVIGKSNPHQKEIREIIRDMPNTDLSIQVDNIHEYIERADFSIGAGGSTTWERCCLGLPSLVISIADNQTKVAKDVALKGAQIWLGESKEVTISSLVCHINCLYDSPLLLSHISSTALKLVDGKGVSRVARVLIEEDVELRSAIEKDCESLFVWRNSEIIRQSSFNSDPIPWERHVEWFSNILSDPSKCLLIGEKANRPIGVLRYDLENGKADVSIYMVPGVIGQGLGTSLLKAGNKWLKLNKSKIKTVESQVQSFNKASHNLFNKAGFEDKFHTYQLML